MTDSVHCAWCGRLFVRGGGPGRPASYCRRSHRQRAFEARRRAHRARLLPGEAVVSASALDLLRDRVYLLESALADVEGDLGASTDPEEYRAAFRHLYAAAVGLRGGAIEAVAVDRSDGR